MILDGENGFLTEATPEALAERIDRLYLDRKLAMDMGRAGIDRIEQLGITWDRVMEKLLR